ncbi:Phosphoserine phosphatase 1 [Paenibacillus konkukensis]|uniref:Phosphoserine phosphatase 1 n=1 Tax=Paenibacillus konkukensis TaxID=2020716 RepID=A0ABY4RVX1_9BACL|nr:histidine phosphatase family protein [Paenibacillus konkukensis]UQZ86520.1 Phosphoserine phosphatase 1 [Paenibacillus konkukensis]
MTRVILIRHGETAANREPVFQGHMNNALSEAGVCQAERLAERLSVWAIDALYCSDLPRAVQTAQIIAGRRSGGGSLATSAALREIDRGRWTGISYADCLAADPDGWRASRRDPYFRCPGGESFVDLHHRIVKEVSRIASLHPGGSVAMVTHGGPIRAFFRHCVGLPPDENKKTRNCAACSASVVPGFRHSSIGVPRSLRRPSLAS